MIPSCRSDPDFWVRAGADLADAALKIDYDIGQYGLISLVTAWSETFVTLFETLDFTADQNIAARQGRSSTALIEDLRITSPSDQRICNTAGIYYLNFGPDIATDLLLGPPFSAVPLASTHDETAPTQRIPR